MKFILSVAVVAGAFFAVLMGGGTAVGVWKELDPPATSAAADRAVRTLKGTRGGESSSKERGAKPRAKGRSVATNRWVREANKLCRSAKAEAGRVPKVESLEDAEAVVSRLAELNARYNARLAAVPPPPRQRAKVDRLERLFAKDEVLIDRLQDAIRDRDARRIADLSDRLVIVSERENQILYDLGALECAL